MANASGIIFSNLHDQNITELTRLRTMASVPFGSRYRLVDFPLSNMVNAGIHNVSIITHYNYQSLMDHVGSGKDWDLARRSGGLKILPPFITASSNSTNRLYENRLQALQTISSAIAHMTGDYVVMSDCDSICNIDLSDMLKTHIKSGAKLTYAVKRMNLTADRSRYYNIIVSDEENNITDVIAHPGNMEGEMDININIAVVNKDFLEAFLLDAAAHGYSSLSRDIVQRNIGKISFKVYRFDGFYSNITSLTDFYACNMSLLERSNREDLFSVKNRPILTKVRNSPPTKFSDDCHVSNSLIADGCVIEGMVENSILFRGVKVGRGTLVRNSILFQDTLTGENVTLNCVIADKNAVLRDGVMLSGHPTMPLYIEKGKMI